MLISIWALAHFTGSEMTGNIALLTYGNIAVTVVLLIVMTLHCKEVARWIAHPRTTVQDRADIVEVFVRFIELTFIVALAGPAGLVFPLLHIIFSTFSYVMNGGHNPMMINYYFPELRPRT